MIESGGNTQAVTKLAAAKVWNHFKSKPSKTYDVNSLAQLAGFKGKNSAAFKVIHDSLESLSFVSTTKNTVTVSGLLMDCMEKAQPADSNDI